MQQNFPENAQNLHLPQLCSQNYKFRKPLDLKAGTKAKFLENILCKVFFLIQTFLKLRIR